MNIIKRGPYLTRPVLRAMWKRERKAIKQQDDTASLPSFRQFMRRMGFDRGRIHSLKPRRENSRGT